MKITTHEWLASGQTNLGDAECGDDPHEAGDFLVGEDRPSWIPSRSGRHAIRTTQIAAVGDRDPEIVVFPTEAIDQ
jgi:hypothetical protein